MQTTVVWVKDFRQNISSFIKKSQKDNTSFLIMCRNRPVLEVKPCFNLKLELDGTQINYYKTLESTLDFWKSSEDDDIFKF